LKARNEELISFLTEFLVLGRFIIRGIGRPDAGLTASRPHQLKQKA
jgi:hypothetical protein